MSETGTATPLPAPYLLVPTSDERTMAVLAHAFQLFGGWIAPLIIFLVKRDSRFVSFHALQALLWQIAHFLLGMAIGMIWVVVFFLAFLPRMEQHSTQFPTPFFLLFPVFWVLMMGMWALTVVLAIVYGIRANRGEWAAYPVFGRLARKMLKINAYGTPVQSR